MDFNSFIGKTCRVISKQNVRYSGTLQLIDAVERKIRVTNVRCHGTEDRPAEMFMPAIQEPFGLVEFNVNDLKDLRFDEEDSTPAAASAQPAPPAQPAQPQYPTPQQPQQTSQQQRPPQQSVPPPSFSAEKALPPNFNVYQATAPVPPPATSAANVPPAAANTESLNRAMGNMKLNGNTPTRTNGANAGPHSAGRGGGRGRGRGRGTGNHHHQQPRAEIKIPASDFDFEASNKLFDKDSTVQQYIQQQQPFAGATLNSIPADKAAQASPVSVAANAGKKEDDAPVVKEKVYNPKASFFDNISSDLTGKKPVADKSGTAPEAQDDSGGGRGRGRGRGGPSYGRMRRDEERERNVETFGEPGGVGLMGPGSYVGGYGGYRGKRRRGGGPRGGGRGGATGNAPRVAVNTN